jgi:RDD family/GYF domain 2
MNQSADGSAWYYSSDGVSTVGPISASDVRQLASSGAIGWQHSVRHTSWEQWYTLRQSAQQLGMEWSTPQAPSPEAAALPIVSRSAVTSAANTVPHFAIIPPPPRPAPSSPSIGGAVVAAAGPMRPADLVAIGPLTAMRRATSWAIDTAVFAVIALLLVAIFPTVIATFFGFCAFVAYTAILPLKGQATVGHIATGLRIVRTDSDDPVDWLVLGTRSAVVLLLAAPCLVGIVCSTITMFAHDSARAWQDVATGTTLIRVNAWKLGGQPTSMSQQKSFVERTPS